MLNEILLDPVVQHGLAALLALPLAIWAFRSLDIGRDSQDLGLALFAGAVIVLLEMCILGLMNLTYWAGHLGSEPFNVFALSPLGSVPAFLTRAVPFACMWFGVLMAASSLWQLVLKIWRRVNP